MPEALGKEYFPGHLVVGGTVAWRQAVRLVVESHCLLFPSENAFGGPLSAALFPEERRNSFRRNQKIGFQ